MQKVELEIIPIGNNFNIFINQFEKESYYHIYINDNKEELKRNYLVRNDKAKKIKVILDGEIKSFSKLFKNCVDIQKITFIKFNRKI